MSEIPTNTAGVWCKFHRCSMGLRRDFCPRGLRVIEGGQATGPICEPWWVGVTVEWQEKYVVPDDDVDPAPPGARSKRKPLP